MNILTILIAILVFGMLVFVHELGHFIAARRSGIRVNEFALGMGPKIFSRKKGETTYALCLFPIGGYCAMGEDDEDRDEFDPHAFHNASLPRRLITLAAGSLMNLLAGLLILGVLTSQLSSYAGTVIGEFTEDAVSNQVLQLEDQIVSVNKHRVYTFNDVYYEFFMVTSDTVPMDVIRGGERISLHVPFKTEETEGIRMISRDFRVYAVKIDSFWHGVRYTFNWAVSFAKQVWGSLIGLVSGRFGVSALSGPVGVTKVIGEAAAWGGWKSVAEIAALIAINLGLFNLLPFPALDGGRIIFLLIEAIRRRPVSSKIENVVNAAGFFLLIGLMIFVTIQDVIRL